MNFSEIKRVLIGQPFPNSRETEERLDNIRGLAIFASDPISSNAYATEAIMTVLVLLGSGALRTTLPIGIGIALLVLIVVFSYIQTILHYPDGGGAYTVAKDNLGEMPSLIAAAALLIDYLLTVSVSIAAGGGAITSAFPQLFAYRVEIALLILLLVTWINLRGVRESGSIFAIPTYAFVAGVFLVIVAGLLRAGGLFGLQTLPVLQTHVDPAGEFTGLAYVWLLLRAFAGGCTALTGIEAISNGVKAFRIPETTNAIKTMLAMAVMAMGLFLGITFLSSHMHLVPNETESILSQMTRATVGNGFLYYWVQFFTAAILILAANTGFQGFPRLASLLAEDNYLPRWLDNRGDRLVYSAGIATLTVLAALMIIFFDADEIAMLPLYALGVMLCFFLSQWGMFRLMGRVAHLKPGETLTTQVTEIHYERGSKYKRFINLFGSLVTLVVFLILLITKFIEGAWFVAALIPLLVILFYNINRHYQLVSQALSTQGLKPESLSGVADVVVVPIADVHRGSLLALQYAKKLSKDVRAVVIVTDPAHKERLLQRWNRFENVTTGISLICVEYDYRDILTPIVDYVVRVNNCEFPNQLTTVVIPEFIAEHPMASVLHNQSGSRLRNFLKNYNDIVIIEVPFHIGSKL
jgi:amino acid transporter